MFQQAIEQVRRLGSRFTSAYGRQAPEAGKS